MNGRKGSHRQLAAVGQHFSASIIAGLFLVNAWDMTTARDSSASPEPSVEYIGSHREPYMRTAAMREVNRLRSE